MTTEDRLRTALRSGAPLALDADAIVRSARRRRGLVLARGGAAAAALLVVAGMATRIMTQTTDAPAPEPGAIVMSTTPTAPTGSQPPGPGTASGIQPASPDVVSGRSLRMFPERWCLVGSSDGREFGCAPLDRHVQRVTDDQDAEWLVMLAPSGPDTAVLQVEQSAAWVNLQSSQVPGSQDRWIGIVPSSEAPEVPRALRALSIQGREIWRS